jgi:hypothetical protein
MMKKLLLILLILMTALSFATAITYTEMKDDFQAFSDDMAGALPFASTLGLNWSNAYLGNFPHFGVGLTTGFVSLPLESFQAVTESMGLDIPSEITDLGIGMPLPAYTVDGRLAIPILPVDVGVKVGYLNPDWIESLSGGVVGVDYLLLGGDVRYGLVKEGILLPAVSVGVGYNYMKGGIYMKGAVPGEDINISSYGIGITNINITDGDMVYEWNANVIDVKAQVSKNLLIFTPSVGIGYSYGFAQAGGGMDATIKIDGSDPTPTQLDAIESATGMTLDDQSLRILSSVQGGSLRAWGGLSVNLFVLKLDLNAMYNIFDQSLGASLNARIQI